MNIHRLPFALLIAMTASPAFAFDTDTATQINTANSLVREGKFDEAISVYESASATKVEVKEELAYNLGVAQYRKGELATAKKLFTQAAASTEDTLASAARYNLGNCFYADGVVVAEQNKAAAIQSLTQAIEHYRGALAGEPNHVNARANIELANELRKKLQQQEEQQQEEQQQEEQQQEEQQQNDDRQQDQTEENGSQQEESQEANEEQDQQDQQDQQGNQDNQDQQDNQDNQGEQGNQDSQGEQDSGGEQGEQDSQSEQNPSQSAKKSAAQQDADNKPSESADQSADNAPQEKPPQSAGSEPAASDQNQSHDNDHDKSQDNEQAIPSGQLEAATESDGSEQPVGPVGIDDGQAENAPMSTEEALKMLQSVRDRDMLRRLRAEQIERNRHIPTDRDW